MDETTPLGTDTVVIEVTSNATGTAVLGRCTFNLTVTRRTEQRDVIGRPLRPCVLEGTRLAFDSESRKPIIPGQFAPAGEVNRLISQVNDQSWLKHARIAFRPAVARGVPVIKDPDTGPDPEHSLPTMPGEVFIPDFLATAETAEPALVEKACEKAWQNIDPSQKGIPVVFVRGFLNAGNTLGFVPAAAPELIQRSGIPRTSSTRLCEHPRQRLLVGDVTRVGWTLLLEPDGRDITFDKAVNVLAHELGHTLLLDHGNGLDDDSNGTLPPASGPRRFDGYCDPMGLEEDRLTPFVNCEATGSLMQGSVRNCFLLRPLQVEKAARPQSWCPARHLTPRQIPPVHSSRNSPIPIPQ